MWPFKSRKNAMKNEKAVGNNNAHKRYHVLKQCEDAQEKILSMVSGWKNMSPHQRKVFHKYVEAASFYAYHHMWIESDRRVFLLIEEVYELSSYLVIPTCNPKKDSLSLH